MQIFKHDRKTDLNEYFEMQKKNQIGPALYKPELPKYKIKGSYDTGERITNFEEMLTSGYALGIPPPNKYDLPDLNKIKEKPLFVRLYPESAMEK